MNDYLKKALPGEPVFGLLGRDPCAPAAIRHWCELRAKRGVEEGGQDADQLVDVFEIADAMEAWRLEHDGEWRNPPQPEAVTTPPTPSDTLEKVAGRVLGGGNPLNNLQVIRAIAKELADRGFSRIVRNEDGPGATDDLLRDALQVVLAPYFANATSLAGFVVNASDGPE